MCCVRQAFDGGAMLVEAMEEKSGPALLFISSFFSLTLLQAAQ